MHSILLHLYDSLWNERNEVHPLFAGAALCMPRDTLTYTSESQEQAELAQIRAAIASSNFWRPLSPYPQLVIFGFLLLLSWISRRAREKNKVYWGLNGPLNLYFAVQSCSLLTPHLIQIWLVQTADYYLLFHSWLFVIALLLFFAINAMPLQEGWDYLFVKHPAADIVNSAVRHGTPIDGKSHCASALDQPARTLSVAAAVALGASSGEGAETLGET